jgi:hypothetical protein
MKTVVNVLVCTRSLTLILAAALAPLLGTTARAGSVVLDFGISSSGPSASLAYSGGASDLVGTGIVTSDVLGTNTPLNDGVDRAIQGGVLSFTSGTLTSSDSTNWFFGVGPAQGLSITGGVSSIGINDPATVLLSGQIQSAHVTEVSGVFLLSVAAFLDTVDTALAASYGLPGGGSQWNGSFVVNSIAAATPSDGFSAGLVLGGDILTSVPEPSSLILGARGSLTALGSGMLARRARGKRPRFEHALPKLGKVITESAAPVPGSNQVQSS